MTRQAVLLNFNKIEQFNLQFKPRYAIVDNVGSNWVHFPDAYQWVPPGFISKVVDLSRLDAGLIHVSNNELPPNVGAVIPTIPVPASIIFTDEFTPLSGGTPSGSIPITTTAPLQTFQPQTELDSGNVVANTNSTHGPYNLPAGCHTVAVLLDNTNCTFGVRGVTTGISYQYLANSVPGYYLVGIASPADTQIFLDVNTPVANGVNWWLTAILDAQLISDPSVYPLGTTPAIINANGWGTLMAIQDYATNRIRALTSTLYQDEQHLPHQGIDVAPPRFASQSFAVALAAGATLDLVAGILGQTIYALEWEFDVVTAAVAEIDLQDDTGIILSRARTDQTGTRNRHLWGSAVAPSHKVQMKNTAGIGAGSIVGEFVYAQY